MKTYIGRIAPVFKGEWNNVVHYTYMDVVYYKGSSYVNLVTDNYNIIPVTSMNGYWQMIANRGGDGINYEDLNIDYKDF